MNADDVIGAQGQGEVAWIFFDEAIHGVDLFERGLYGVGPFEFDGHEDRPELAPHPAPAHARDVGVHRRLELLFEGRHCGRR